MKKASYLQWMMLMGATAILASACVVTSSSDDDDDFFDGGEGGTSSTAGKPSTGGAGTSSTSGSTSGGTAGSATAGTGGSATAGTGGTGGTAPAYVPGVCEGGEEPTSVPACALNAEDEDADKACRKCLKTKCCTEWKTCFGDTPTNACAYGATAEADGQFDCIRNCYADGLAEASDLSELIDECSGKCLNQCEDGANDMGFVTTITNDLLGCVQKEGDEGCLDDCFPAQ